MESSCCQKKSKKHSCISSPRVDPTFLLLFKQKLTSHKRPQYHIILLYKIKLTSGCLGLGPEAGGCGASFEMRKISKTDCAPDCTTLWIDNDY
jgi:hypothetical protein